MMIASHCSGTHCLIFFLSGCLRGCGSFTKLGSTQPLAGPMHFFHLRATGIVIQSYLVFQIRKFDVFTCCSFFVSHTSYFKYGSLTCSHAVPSSFLIPRLHCRSSLAVLYNACVDFTFGRCSLFDAITLNPVIGVQMTKAYR